MLAHIATILAFGTLLGSASTCREDKRPHPSGQILLGTQYLTLAEPKLPRAACLVLQFSHVEKSATLADRKLRCLSGEVIPENSPNPRNNRLGPMERSGITQIKRSSSTDSRDNLSSSFDAS